MSGLKTHENLDAKTANFRKLRFETVDQHISPAKLLETSWNRRWKIGESQNGKPHHSVPVTTLSPHNWSIWGTSEQGLNHIMSFREKWRHQFGPPTCVGPSGLRSSFQASFRSKRSKGYSAADVKADLWTLAMPERANSISNPYKLLGSSHVKKKEPLAGNNRGCRGYVHIYTYFWKAIVLFSWFYSPGLRQILWSLLSWHCCCRFCGFCLLGFLVVLLLGFVGYLAAWFLVFFTCQCPHSWRHIAHLDRNYWFLVFFFSFFGWCCCFMEVMVWLTSVVLWCFMGCLL